MSTNAAPGLCSVFSGILFTRKQCAEPGVHHCVRCSQLVCARHSFDAGGGGFRCAPCERYVNSDDTTTSDSYSDSSTYRSSSTSSSSNRPAVVASESDWKDDTPLSGKDSAGLGPRGEPGDDKDDPDTDFDAS